MPPYTAEQLSQMTIEEINSNWEDVKTSLRILYEQRSDEERS